VSVEERKREEEKGKENLSKQARVGNSTEMR